MRHFHDMFGDGPTLQLSSTFRCAPTICETAGRFVTKNPSQLTKTVRSAQDRPGGPVRLIGAQGLDDYLGALSGRVADHEFGAPLSVMLLGRYQHNRQLMPNAEYDGLRLEFRTVHGAKGLEADVVIIANMTSGRLGFPSDIVDDPLLDLFMVAGDRYRYAEERRLLYVALTGPATRWSS